MLFGNKTNKLKQVSEYITIQCIKLLQISTVSIGNLPHNNNKHRNLLNIIYKNVMFLWKKVKRMLNGLTKASHNKTIQLHVNVTTED